MKAKPQYWRKKSISHDPKDIEDPANAPYVYERPDGTKFINWYSPQAISRDPKDLDDPANAQYLYESPDGDRFIDWNNPGHKLERWAERISILASGDQEKIMEYYTDLYYNRLAKRLGLGPDNDNVERASEQTSVTELPPSYLPIPAEEVLQLIRGLKEKVCILEKQKVLLSQAAADSGCPNMSDPDCPMKNLKAEISQNPACVECWQKYADATIKKLPSKITGILPA